MLLFLLSALIFASDLPARQLQGPVNCHFDNFCDNFQKVEIQPAYMEAAGEPLMPTTLAEWETLNTRIHKIFEIVRNEILLMLREKRTPLNSKEIDLVIDRVRTVSLIDHAKEFNNTNSLALSSCPMPNAFYSSYNHSITFCPQTLNWPQATLEMIASHEIAHSFDPCALSRILVHKNSRYQLLGTREIILNQDRPGTAPFSRSLKQEKSPFLKINQCLNDPLSAGARVPTVQEIVQITDSSYSKTTPIHGFTIEALMEKTGVTYQNRGEAIRRHHKEFKYCSDFSGSSFLAEAFADWLSAEYLARRILADQIVQRDSLDALGFLWRRCTQKVAPDQHHLSADLRVNRIFLAHPILRRSLGCSEEPAVRQCQ